MSALARRHQNEILPPTSNPDLQEIEIVTVLKQTPRYEYVSESGVTAPSILSLGTRWR